MKRVMIDMDGVLCDFIQGFTMRASARGSGAGVWTTREHKEWDFDHVLSQEVTDSTWKGIVKCHKFWRDLPSLLTPGDEAALKRLSEEHDCYFVTSRPGVNVRVQSQGWLIARGVPNPAVIVVPTLASKGEMAHVLGADYSIEDKAGNAICVAYMSRAKSYIIDRPYNQFNPAVVGSKVRRVRTFTEFTDDIATAR